ncbi:hypothetical protein M885DRAFT_547096 [Pelagophyceae sp. CCMP2097]|nr:hypothetical protein M885DRAFT_547096 [Pelagophyceae sp. CCMP2097]
MEARRARQRSLGFSVECVVVVLLVLCPVGMYLAQELPVEQHPLLTETLLRFRGADTTGFDPFDVPLPRGGPPEAAEAPPAAAAQEAQPVEPPVPAPRARPAAGGGGDESGLPPMYDDGSGEPIIVGEEQCAAFRSMTSDRRRPAAAGLFNTGTNFLWKLLRNNCIMPHECPGRDGRMYDAEARVGAESWVYRNADCSPFLLQAPWGKHNPLHWRGEHTAENMDRVNVSEVLPVAVIKDPLTWFRSMCKMSYAAEFRHGHCQCCPSPLMRTHSVVRWRKEREPATYASIVHMWSRWNAEYFDSDVPRLMVRYEDLLWRTEATTKRVCDCVGGKMRPVFKEIESSAKQGPAHGFADAKKADLARKYGNESNRYGNLVAADLEYLNKNVDHRLVDKFHYGASVARNRAVRPDAAVCKPTRAGYLEFLGLKMGDEGPIPLDDESDGVVAAGRWYPNPKKPRLFNRFEAMLHSTKKTARAA